MHVIFHEKVSAADLPENAMAEIHLLCVQIDDIHRHAQDLISYINDTSWINQLAPVAKKAYEKTVERTVKALVEIFQKVENKVTQDFGEYMVSISASNGMGEQLSHRVFPISELWQYKTLKNHGFDFHTESANELLSFGEAKYKSKGNPYTDAADQVLRFIGEGRDFEDAPHLVYFASPAAFENLQNNKRGFTVAFSLHSANHVDILTNALNSDLIKELSTLCNEMYIIGVKA